MFFAPRYSEAALWSVLAPFFWRQSIGRSRVLLPVATIEVPGLTQLQLINGWPELLSYERYAEAEITGVKCIMEISLV